MHNRNRIDRRQFVGNLAAGSGTAAVLLVPPLIAFADDKPPVEPKPEANAQAVLDQPAMPSEEALLLACLTQRYPSDHFDEAALQGIYRDLHGDTARSKVLSGFPLRNSDEPCFAFRAYRAPE